MKRRRALRNIVILSSATAWLPSCCYDPQVEVYERIPIKYSERKFFDGLVEALLPTATTGLSSPESSSNFILTVLNDCHSSSDIQKFVEGLREVRGFVRQNLQADSISSNSKESSQLFDFFSNPAEHSASVKYFYDTTRNLAIEHFTTSEYYMKNVLKWEFAPGYFNGCIPV